MQALVSELTNLVLSKSAHESIVRITRKVLFDLINNPRSDILINWHPLGFLQLKLHRTPDGISTKIHIWDDHVRSVQDPAWLIHRHEWDLTSHILWGEIENSIYELQPLSNVFQPTELVHLYKVEFEGQDSIMLKTDMQAGCKLLHSTVYTEGDRYDVLTDEYHTTETPVGKFSATLVVSMEQSVSNPFVAGKADGESIYRYHRTVSKYEEWQPIVNKLLHKLNSADAV